MNCPLPAPPDSSGFLCVASKEVEETNHYLDGAGTILHAPSGTFIHHDASGNLDMAVMTVTAVVLAEMDTVVSHRSITLEDGATSHLVHFECGGQVECAFDSDGDLVSFDGRQIEVTLRGDRLIVGAL